MLNYYPQQAEASTIIPGGFIFSDTTWNISGSPYIITGDVSIGDGATLTIDPGVEVKFDGYFKIVIYGTLHAEGNQSNRITFTSNKATPSLDDWNQIEISSLGNAQIDYCNFSYATTGLSLSNSIPLRISNCSFTNNQGNGIYVASPSEDNIFTNNFFSGNLWGIRVWITKNQYMINNSFSSNGEGIRLWKSTNIKIIGNNFTNDGVVIEGEALQHFNSHYIPANNLVNGKPLYYYKNTSGINIDGIPVGQLILANCTSMNVRNLHIDYTASAVQLAFSSYIHISNNNLSNSLHGIYLSWEANYNNITNNIIGNHYSSGVLIIVSSNNNIIGNNISSNRLDGIYMVEGSYTNFLNNEINFNDLNGIRIGVSTFNIISKNQIKSNTRDGIDLYSWSGSNIITENNISNNIESGIILRSSSSNNYIYHNNIINNTIQASDEISNFWDDGYPSGGNYWSDWSPICNDSYDGAVTPQITGSPDGICDEQYDIDGDSIDYYPLKYPYIPPIDEEPPTFIDVFISPNPQEVHDYVNISTMISDNDQVQEVWLDIIDPNNGSIGNYSMKYDALNNRFYHNASYNILGIYKFSIWVSDMNDNWNSTMGLFTIRDTTIPLIINSSVIPVTQDIFGFVNVSSEISDNYDLFNGLINVSYPDGSHINTTLNRGLGDIFYFNQSYGLIGSYGYTIWANDTSNNWNYSSGSFFIVDSTLPSINNIITIPDVQEVFGEVNISASVTDNYELYEVWINITDPDGSSLNVTMTRGAGDEFFLNQNYDMIGIYGFVIWANDTSDNLNFDSGSFTIEDTTVPVISSVLSNPPIQNILENVNISAYVTDNYAIFGVWVNISYPDGSSINISMNTISAFEFYLNQTYNQAGIYDFTIWANDTSNNWNFKIGSFQIQDSTLPGAQVEVISPYWKNDSTIEIIWTASDNTGLANITMHYRYSDDNSTWGPWVEYAYDNSVSGTSAGGSFQFSANQDGYYEFFVNASDIDNNWEPDPLVEEAIAALDTSSPSSSMSILKYWHTLASFIINFQTEESLPSSGIKDVTEYYRFSLDNLSWGPWEEYSGNDMEGYYEFYSIVIDNAGNTESKTTRDTMCAIDNTPPQANAGEDIEIRPGFIIIFDGSGSSDNFGVIDNYTWTITNNSEIISVLYGSNPMFTFDQSGNYQLTLTVMDRSGNIGQDTMTINVFIDLEVPSITHSANPEIQEVGGSVNITSMIIDNIEVFGVWIQIFNPDNNEIVNISMNRIGLAYNYSYNNLYSITGNYEYDIWANDTSDNWAFEQGSFVIQDSTPPVAIAGEDFNTKIEKKVIFDGSESSDNVGITNYTWNITRNGDQIITLYGMNPSYKFKKEGKYDVVLTVKDASGKIGEDTISVKVEPVESDWCWLIILIIIIIAIVIAYIIWKRQLKPKQTEVKEESPDRQDERDEDILSENHGNEK